LGTLVLITRVSLSFGCERPGSVQLLRELVRTLLSMCLRMRGVGVSSFGWLLCGQLECPVA
jgi:hypothetical protein